MHRREERKEQVVRSYAAKKQRSEVNSFLPDIIFLVSQIIRIIFGDKIRKFVPEYPEFVGINNRACRTGKSEISREIETETFACMRETGEAVTADLRDVLRRVRAVR